MKFGYLKLFLYDEIENIKKDKTIIKQKPYIISAYQKVLNKINKSYNNSDVVSDKKINSLNITNHMKEKLIYFSKQNISKKMIEKKKIIDLKNSLNEILGIGEKKADELIKKGLTNLNQLKTKEWSDEIPLEAKLMIRHKPQRKIPYNEINKLEPFLINFQEAKVCIVGSYRRKKPFLKDIDIMVVSDDEQILKKYIKHLENIFYQIHIYSSGKDKMSLIVKKSKSKSYKFDIFKASKSEYYTMLLYSTGSKEFNINIRKHAKKQGYTLNQKGLYKLDKYGNKIKKINKYFDNEKKIFEILNMKYIKPELR